MIGAFLRNVGFATPIALAFRFPALLRPKTKPPRPEKNGYMWYASPAGACGTAIARLSALRFLNASAWRWSDANVFGTVASLVYTTRPTFSSATGAPYSRLTAVPYENASRAYFGNCLSVAFFGDSGRTRPSAASCPVQSCAPMITSGAVAGATVLS